MHQKDRLQQQYNEQIQRWKKLSADISLLRESCDNETRVEEQIRLESIIKEGVDL